MQVHKHNLNYFGTIKFEKKTMRMNKIAMKEQNKNKQDTAHNTKN